MKLFEVGKWRGGDSVLFRWMISRHQVFGIWFLLSPPSFFCLSALPAVTLISDICSVYFTLIHAHTLMWSRRHLARSEEGCVGKQALLKHLFAISHPTRPRDVLCLFQNILSGKSGINAVRTANGYPVKIGTLSSRSLTEIRWGYITQIFKFLSFEKWI